MWLARRGTTAPSTAALREMLDQLLHASHDAQIELLHDRQALRVYRGRVSIGANDTATGGDQPLRWNGEPRIAVPEWRGTLLFGVDAPGGVDARWLRDGPLSIRVRRGGERLRARADGPSRTLKNLYQESGVPAYRRARLPLLFLGDRLIFAAGLGPNATALTPRGEGTVVRIDWEADG